MTFTYTKQFRRAKGPKGLSLYFSLPFLNQTKMSSYIVVSLIFGLTDHQSWRDLDFAWPNPSFSKGIEKLSGCSGFHRNIVAESTQKHIGGFL